MCTLSTYVSKTYLANSVSSSTIAMLSLNHQTDKRSLLAVTAFALLSLAFLCGCGARYAVRNDAVVRITVDEGRGRLVTVLPGADPATWSVIRDGEYGRDARTVYHYDEPITGADPRTFASLQGRYFIDADRVYLDGDPLMGADPTTFEVLDESWARDRRTVYFGENPIRTCDAETSRVLSGFWARDKVCAYFGFAPIEGADAASFEVLGRYYARTSYRVYGGFGQDLTAAEIRQLSGWTMREQKKGYPNVQLPFARVVRGADPDSFVVDPANDTVARDLDGCYLLGESTPCTALAPSGVR